MNNTKSFLIVLLVSGIVILTPQRELTAQVLPEEYTVVEVAAITGGPEAPVWDPVRECVYFSDQENDKIYKWSEAEGLEEIPSPTGDAKDNGNALDADGYLIHCEGNNLWMESRISKEIRNTLREMGHNVVDMAEATMFFGGLNAVKIDPETGRIHGGADIRRPCAAVGY